MAQEAYEGGFRLEWEHIPLDEIDFHLNFFAYFFIRNQKKVQSGKI